MPRLLDLMLSIPDENYRLFEFRNQFDGGWFKAAELIDGHGIDTLWWPDANIAILDECSGIWETMRVAGFKTGRPCCYFTGTILHELQKWLDEPFKNKERAKLIRDAIESESWAKGVSLDPEDPVTVSVLNYSLLTGQFRNLGRNIDGVTFFGEDIQPKELSNRIEKTFGKRVQEVSKKGRKDSKNGRNPKFNDELNCVMIALLSIQWQCDSIILTADRDVFLTIKVLHELLRIHYCSLHVCKNFDDIKSQKVAHEHPSPADSYFRGPVEFYSHSKHLYSYLPKHPNPITVSVLYVAPTGEVEMRGYLFEAEMFEVIWSRGNSNGVTATLCDGRSVHAKAPCVQSSHIVVAEDLFQDVVSELPPHSFDLRISMADHVNANEFAQETKFD